MSANLSNFAVYVVDDNFFNGEWLKKAIQECQLPCASVEISCRTNLSVLLMNTLPISMIYSYFPLI